MPDLAAGLASVVTALKALSGVDSASTDPADVFAPGIVVELDSAQKDTLGGWALNLTLTLVAADTDGGPGPAAALTVLLNTVLGWAQPDGPVQARSVILPNNPAPLPGLLFPLTVRIDA